MIMCYFFIIKVTSYQMTLLTLQFSINSSAEVRFERIILDIFFTYIYSINL